MIPPVKKFGLLVATVLVSIFAVFVVLEFTSASAANALEAVDVRPASSPQEVNVDFAGLGHWILVANMISSNFSIVNTADDVVYGPFLEDQLGTNGGGRFDIAVTPDGRTALISNFGDSTVFFVNVADPIHPSLITSVTVPMLAEDIDISPDGKYALVTDGGFSPMVASIDIASATLVYTADLGVHQALAVVIAPDGTVIVADYFNNAVHTLLLDEMGVISYAHTYTYTYPGYAITDTHGLPSPVNVGLAPDGQTIIVCDATTSTIGVYQIVAPGVLTFTGMVTGLQGAFQADDYTYMGVQSVAFNAAGDKAYAVVNNYVYSGTRYQDRLAILNIDRPGQVSLEAGGVVTIPHITLSQFFGVDTVAVAGNKVYLGYPTASTPDETTNLAIVNLTDLSVTTTMVLSKDISLPIGVTALPIHLDMHKSVSDRAPHPKQLVTYTLVLTNAGPQVAGFLDDLPVGIVFFGPVTLVPPDAGVVVGAPPILVTNLVISAGQQITVTFPVWVGVPPDGTHILNTARADSHELSRPARSSVVFVVEWPRVYLPAILRKFTP
jgi:hypothetical protein